VCIGIQLALMEIALTTAVFFRECPDARIGDSMKDADMEMEDVFVTTLRGHKCKVFVL
jgi:cytochrome P450